MTDSRKQSETIATFNSISSIADLSPIAQKKGGSRLGYVGIDQQQKPYMVKMEIGGYEILHAGKNNEAGAMESFTAQFIRTVWGNDFATDIRVAPIHLQPLMVEHSERSNAVCRQYDLSPLKEETINPSEGLEQCMEKFAVVVPFEPKSQDCRSYLNSHKPDENIQIKLSMLQTIAKIVGHTDYKFENILVANGNNQAKFKLIDCSGSFHSHKKAELQTLFNDLSTPGFGVVNSKSAHDQNFPFRAEIVEPVLQNLFQFSDKQLTQLLDSYKNVLCDETLQVLEESIRDLKNQLRKNYDAAYSSTPQQNNMQRQRSNVNTSTPPTMNPSAQIIKQEGPTSQKEAQKNEEASDKTPTFRR